MSDACDPPWSFDRFSVHRAAANAGADPRCAAFVSARKPTAFERNAHRFVGNETLRQTQPDGTRFGTGPRGITTELPGVVHEIVSEYGYISSDEPGGSLKEVRLVLTVDGLKWKSGKKDLSDSGGTDRQSDAKNRGHTLESYEDYGLRGFLSDAGQLILLFARHGVEKYEFMFDRSEIGAARSHVGLQIPAAGRNAGAHHLWREAA